MNRILHNFAERYAQRLGVRMIEFTGLFTVAALATPDIANLMTAHGMAVEDILTKTQLVGFLSATTALYETALRRDPSSTLPTFTHIGLARNPSEEHDSNPDIDTR